MVITISPMFLLKINAEDTIYHDGIWEYQVENGHAVLVGTTEWTQEEVCGPPSFLGGYALKEIAYVMTGKRTTTFIIPPGVERIRQAAFNGSNFTTVVMPASLKYIDFNSFCNCFNMTTIYYEGSADSWNDIHIDYPSLSNAPVVNATKYFGYTYDESYYTYRSVIHGREFDKNIDYFTENWDSGYYNPLLANILAALSAAAYSEEEIEEAYKSLGFTENFSKNYHYVFDPSRCSYAIGFKKSNYSDEIICLITFRGSVSVSDWLANADIVTYDEKHQGFLVSAVLVRNQILSILGSIVVQSVNLQISVQITFMGFVLSITWKPHHTICVGKCREQVICLFIVEVVVTSHEH